MPYNDAGEWVNDPKLVELHALAKKIATQLGWTYTEAQNTDRDGRGALNWGAEITHADLRLHIQPDKAKLTINGGCPNRSKKGGAYRSDVKLTIGVSRDKGAEAICHDIERRLLPALYSEAKKAAAWIAERDAENDATDAARERVRVAGRASHHGESFYLQGLPEGVYARATVNTATSCKLDLSGLHPDQVIAIAELLRKG